ncbi:MAG: [FeFe] hydrogenase H-cluster radical SAM maturase HydE [Bacteroidetes bacterium]|nr:[FeFe] hydrogenase H-cluster radical SAM maturase HydE [Bacteroidota bacterium]MBU2505886.1 [FeFe] hydrogenase H-cluster radical SAM maturase HydE [Bacteroidota bacterium]
MTREEVLKLLNSNNSETESLFNSAYETKLKYVGNKVYFRGIIELSNICQKDCYYCGIRKSNLKAARYIMSEEEIIDSAMWAYDSKYGSIVLQAGEREDRHFVDFIEKIIKEIHRLSSGKLGITLSLGEQKFDIYERWFRAGAHRYLIRIETSSKSIYEKLHPADHSFERRLQCLQILKDIGYQVGTGVMIGLPYQTINDLVDDLFFFQENNIDMIGMGPYLVSSDTPLQSYYNNYSDKKNEIYLLGLKMIAAARILLKDVNIASTTALQALKPFGREMGLKAGANIIMPNLTPIKYREDYQLYDEKPCLDEDRELCKDCLDNRILGIDEEIGYGEWGDSPHFLQKK